MIGDVIKPMPSDRGCFVYHLFLLELGTVYCWLCLVNCWVENDMTKFGGAFGAPFLKSRLRNELQVACRKSQQLFFLGGFQQTCAQLARNIGYNICIYIYTVYIYIQYIYIHSIYIYIYYTVYIYIQYIYIYTVYIYILYSIYIHSIYIYIGHNIYIHTVYIYIYAHNSWNIGPFLEQNIDGTPDSPAAFPLPGVLAGQWRLCQGLPHGGPGNNEEALRGIGFSLWYVYIYTHISRYHYLQVHLYTYTHIYIYVI